MAGIIHAGAVPRWGIQQPEDNSLLVNSIQFTTNISEYTQTGMAGNVVGWLAYDQYIDWTMQAAPVLSGKYVPPVMATLFSLNNFELSGVAFNSQLGGGTAQTSILKKVDSTMSSGEAVQLSLTGSIYNFAAGIEGDCHATTYTPIAAPNSNASNV